MAYQSVLIGSYQFTATSRIEPAFMRPSVVQKLLGQNRSVIANWGTYGAVPWHFQGIILGSTGRTDLWSVVGELNRPDPVLIKTDVLMEKSTSGAWGCVLSILPVELPGYVIYGEKYDYGYDITFIQSLRADEADRGTLYGVVQENDTFSITGDTVVPLPVGAASASETVDFSRYADDGAGGTNTIPCVLNPDMTQITYAVATEANLAKSNVTLTRSGREYILSNGLVKLQTRHDEAGTQGYVEAYYYNGTAWVQAASLRALVNKSAGSLQEATASTRGPEVWSLFSGDRERQGLRMKYPPTATDSLEAILEVEVERGRPGFKWKIESATPTTTVAALVGCEYQLSLVPTDFTYWTHDTTEEDATSGAHGTPDVVAGDSDAVNVNWVSTTTGAPVAATILTGFGRRKKADSDDVADDAGDCWDYLAQRFDNVTIAQGYQFEPVWVYMGRYDKIGSRTAANLASEALARVTGGPTIIPRI